ncbi:MAG: hypothetical protein SNI45_02755 [Rikenellaceae bacterium]
MKKFSVTVRCLVVAAFALAVSSCGSSFQDKVSIEGVENLEIMGMSGVKGDVIFRNRSWHKIMLNSVSVTLKKNDKRVATLELKDPITIPRRTDSTAVATIWRLRNVDALAALNLTRDLSSPEASRGFKFDIEAEVKMGMAKRTVHQNNVSTSQLLKALNN